MKPTVPNPILRLQARMAIAKNRGTIMLISLTSMLFYMLFQAFVQRALYSDYDALSALVNSFYGGEVLSAEASDELISRILTSAKPNLMIAGGCLVMWVLTAFLSTGRAASELKLARGLEITPADALSRSGIWLKAIGHRLYLILRILLWTLPGLGLMMLTSGLAVRAILGGASESSMLVQIAPMIMLQGMAGMFFLSGWAYLRYAVSGIILADRPETGVLESVRLSKAFMKGRMGRMVLLALVFVGLRFVSNYIASLLLTFNPVVGLMADMAFSLMLLLYYDMTLCMFYLDGKEDPEEKSPLSDTPEDPPETL